MNDYLNYLVDTVSRRYRLVRLAWVLSVAWLILAAAVIFVSASGALPTLGRGQQIALGLGALIATFFASWIACRRLYRNRRWVALQIEEHFPSLRQRLITAIQLRDANSFFEKSLVNDTIRHARTHDWSQTVSGAHMWVALLCSWVSLGIAGLTIIQFWDMRPSNQASSIAAMFGMSAPNAMVVEPGDVEVERGTDVVVTIRFPGEAPIEAWLETNAQSADLNRKLMNRSLKDPIFGGYLRNVQSDQEYRIDYLAGKTRPYRITTFEYPALVRSDATIESPAYANLQTRTIEDTRRVTVVDGASLTWTCTVNKPLLRAELVDESGLATDMRPTSENPLCYQANFNMTESHHWKLRLVDEQQRACKFEEELVAKVIFNQEPEIKLARASDLRVSPLQEFQIRATVQDDFGVQKSGLVIAIGDNEHQEVDVEATAQKSGKVDLTHMVDLESMKAEPDQLLSYYFWSEDVDRDGNPRRVDGEMFFAEVRPFEEIFREGQSMSREQQRQQQQQQQSPAGQKAEELSELQKQIMTATWNVLRREKPDRISDDFEFDVTTILESQREALQKTEELKDKLDDAKSLDYLDQVRDAMTSAIENLEESASPANLKKLRDALQQERKANEGLLKLRAREHQIVQSQQQNSPSSQSASQRNRQAQLDQLKLQNDENRYESEQQADASEPSAQRETRQVMNRLEELARRQKDVNEQLKNLESELREAKTEEKKKEIEEQLQRLRDNQEELLRDTDELLERMNQPENRQAMQEAREQTEQARSDLQKASESLSKGDTAQSRSSGTRAERQLDETREQLRKESSNQFEQTMRNLLHQAESLEQQQQKLAERLSPTKDSSPANTRQSTTQERELKDDSASPLRPEGDDQSVDSATKAWQDQKRDLNDLLDKVRETVSEAESSEPLLAEQLYDTFRETKQKGIEQRLDQIPKFVERGLEEPASRAAQEATQGIRSLREGIEEASRGVLGSEQESLRRALDELQRAQRQLNSELANKDPQSDRDANEPQAQGQRQPGDRSGEPSNEAQSEPSNQPNQPRNPGERNGQPSGEQPSSSEQQGEQQRGQGGQQGGQRSGQANRGDQRATPGSPSSQNRLERMTGPAAERSSDTAPLTGNEYSAWMDSLRDVEELVRDPGLRAEAARIREAARSMRVEYKRHSKEPEWPLVRRLIANPLERLRDKVQEELLRLSAERNAVVPIDRDPVPSVYQQQLDRYYENLGSGKNSKDRGTSTR